jgi:hypothetical protein
MSGGGNHHSSGLFIACQPTTALPWQAEFNRYNKERKDFYAAQGAQVDAQLREQRQQAQLFQQQQHQLHLHHQLNPSLKPTAGGVRMPSQPQHQHLSNNQPPPPPRTQQALWQNQLSPQYQNLQPQSAMQTSNGSVGRTNDSYRSSANSTSRIGSSDSPLRIIHSHSHPGGPLVGVSTHLKEYNPEMHKPTVAQSESTNMNLHLPPSRVPSASNYRGSSGGSSAHNSFYSGRSFDPISTDGRSEWGGA